MPLISSRMLGRTWCAMSAYPFAPKKSQTVAALLSELLTCPCWPPLASRSCAGEDGEETTRRATRCADLCCLWLSAGIGDSRVHATLARRPPKGPLAAPTLCVPGCSLGGSSTLHGAARSGSAWERGGASGHWAAVGFVLANFVAVLRWSPGTVWLLFV